MCFEWLDSVPSSFRRFKITVELQAVPWMEAKPEKALKVYEKYRVCVWALRLLLDPITQIGDFQHDSINVD